MIKQQEPMPTKRQERDATRTIETVAALKDLDSVAGALNDHSVAFAEAIRNIEVVLQKKNIGVSAWVSFMGNVTPPEGKEHWSNDLGYGKVNGKWGIAIRITSGSNETWKELDKWLLLDAPRRYRLDAILKLPELFQALKANAEKMDDTLVLRTAWLKTICDELKDQTC